MRLWGILNWAKTGNFGVIDTCQFRKGTDVWAHDEKVEVAYQLHYWFVKTMDPTYSGGINILSSTRYTDSLCHHLGFVSHATSFSTFRGYVGFFRHFQSDALAPSTPLSHKASRWIRPCVHTVTLPYLTRVTLVVFYGY